MILMESSVHVPERHIFIKSLVYNFLSIEQCKFYKAITIGDMDLMGAIYPCSRKWHILHFIISLMSHPTTRIFNLSASNRTIVICRRFCIDIIWQFWAALIYAYLAFKRLNCNWLCVVQSPPPSCSSTIIES